MGISVQNDSIIFSIFIVINGHKYTPNMTSLGKTYVLIHARIAASCLLLFR